MQFYTNEKSYLHHFRYRPCGHVRVNSERVGPEEIQPFIYPVAAADYEAFWSEAFALWLVCGAGCD